MVGSGKSMWLRPSPWPDTTALCLGDDRGEKTVDRVTEGEVRSRKGKEGPCHQREDGFASVKSRGTPHGDLIGVSGTTSLPLKGSKTVKIARPPHNSR